MTFNKHLVGAGIAMLGIAAATAALASSHREAPFITTAPKVDGTDFYMFNSYQTGRAGFVTVIANYLPLQDAYGGPNYFTLDPSALYEIHIDNNADANEDLTFQFRFNTLNKGLTLNVGTNAGNTKSVAVPLANIGGITAANAGAQNLVESYTLDIVRGDRRSGTRTTATKSSNGSATFEKPFDYIGEKSFGNAAAYANYANSFIHDIAIPGCSASGSKVFVGQRREGFVVNLGETFDLVNIAAPAEALNSNARNLEVNTIADKNVTSIALEIPAACLGATANNPIVGGWTTASLRQARVVNARPQRTSMGSAAGNTGTAKQGGAWVQVSRLGAPLVNEVVIGLPDKDLFNATEPKDDAARFADYVTNPTLPELLEILFGGAGVKAPDVFPRTDLLAAFLTGVEGLNKPANVVASEMLRLNTSISAKPISAQNDLGVLGGDTAGFPNGRRPIDDVVDIELRVAMGILLPDSVDGPSVQSRKFGYTDGARPNPADYLTVFPYLNHPLPGSPGNSGN